MDEFGGGFLRNLMFGFVLALLVSFYYAWTR
jgi:hypothetical protein